MGGHSDGDKKNQFCSLRADPCPCGNSYTKPCDGQAAGWGKYAQKYKSGAIERSYEAHHIACVASVTEKITSNDDIKLLVWNTKWCVNVASNMIALPMWGHTLTWYVDLTTGDLKQKEVAGKFVSTVGPPPFADRTQHNYDHGPYLKEVGGDLQGIADKYIEALEEHPDDPSGALASDLDAVISSRKGQLQKGGTHAAWQLGMNDREGPWYMPFSMATSPTQLVFPFQGNKMANRLAELRAAFAKLGA